MPTDGPCGSGGSGGKRRLGVSCNSRSWISSVRSVVMPVSISIPTMHACHLCWSGREGLPGWPPLFRREPCERQDQSLTFREMNPASSLACCLQARENLILTVFAVQHPAAHGLFDFLLATQPHTVQPGAGMVLVHEIAVESHHCRPIKVIFIV